MKKYLKYLSVFSIVLIVLFFDNIDNTALSCVSQHVAEGVIYENVDANEFKELISKKPGIVIDVRTEREFGSGYINSALNINVKAKDFLARINTLPKDKPVYLYCLSGSRSNYAARIMMKNGFKEVYNLSKGIISWRNLGFPLESGSGDVDAMSMKKFVGLINNDEVVLVDFNAVWCAPCKAMMPIIKKIEQEEIDGLKVLYIDADKNHGLISELGIKGVPAFVVYQKGTKFWQKNGTASYDELKEQITTAKSEK